MRLLALNNHKNMLSVYPIPAFTDNYIWIFQDPTTDLAYVVDPGESAPVFDYLNQQNWDLGGILITHHHWDHTGGIEDLLAKYPVPVYGPDSANIPHITHKLYQGDSLAIGEQLTFDILEIPGHTLDHIAYFLNSEDPLVFCGDTLFAGGCGRIFEGTAAQMHASLGALAQLPKDTRVCCTHEYTLGNLNFAKAVEPTNADLLERIAVDSKTREANSPTLPSTLALELETNPFLRTQSPNVIQAAETFLGASCNSDVEVLAAIRQWKDNF
jgi:hydroxyacylglutathione hydrolase